MKNLLFKDFGTFLNTTEGEQFEINKVIIFKNNEIKMIANYFLDNFANYQFEIVGDIKRKLKEDLTQKINFVVKNPDHQNSWNDKTQYILYINGDLNNYEFTGLNLIGDRLEATYKLNGIACAQCVGWNHLESYKAKYTDFEAVYKECNYFNIDDANYEENLKKLVKLYKKYVKAKETEKGYTVADYKKMELASGTTKEENIIILKNNGLDVRGL